MLTAAITLGWLALLVHLLRSMHNAARVRDAQGDHQRTAPPASRPHPLVSGHHDHRPA